MYTLAHEVPPDYIKKTSPHIIQLQFVRNTVRFSCLNPFKNHKNIQHGEVITRDNTVYNHDRYTNMLNNPYSRYIYVIRNII